jgi:hypothetical protein
MRPTPPKPNPRVQPHIIRRNPPKEHLGRSVRRPTLLEILARFPNGLLG